MTHGQAQVGHVRECHGSPSVHTEEGVVGGRGNEARAGGVGEVGGRVCVVHLRSERSESTRLNVCNSQHKYVIIK